jgi:hypothetical protein
MVTLTLGSGPPKRQIIELAFGDIGSAGYEFGRTPEEVNDALLRLNALMREHPFSTLAYEQPSFGVGSPDEMSGMGDQWLNVVALSLAERICGMMGATLATEARNRLARGMALLNASAATIPTMPFADGTPAGAGTRRSTFLSTIVTDDEPTDPGDLAGLLG